MANWTITIPTEPTPRLVLVTNISGTSTADKVKEFFLFCGKIADFELRSTDGTQSALILFEKESAAKTATMLSNAVIGDTQINVNYYFSSEYSADPHNVNTSAVADSRTADEGTQEAKPKTGIINEIITAGFQLSQAIIARAKEFDQKYGVSTHLQAYYQQALTQLTQFEEKYQLRKTLTDKAAEVDTRYAVRENVAGVVGQVQGVAGQVQASVQGAAGQVQAGVQGVASTVIASGPGQVATGLYNQAVEQVSQVIEQTRKKSQATTETANKTEKTE